MAFYPLAATLISAAFAITLFRQYSTKRRPYLLAWALALSVYALAALTEVIGAAQTWNPFLYRAYYFLGGVLVVGLLALGTFYLLLPRFATLALVILVAIAGLGLLGVLGANLQTGLLDTHQVPNVDTIRVEKGVFNTLALAAAAFLNIAGSLILIGGALLSAYRLRRQPQLASRFWANLLIALGAFIVAGASSLTRLHIYELFYMGQAAGVLVMFSGFLTAQRQPARAPNLSPARR
jgi:hypothetical protein